MKYWKVFVGDKEYELSDAKIQFMKRENQINGVTSFWFEDTYISYPHISSMKAFYKPNDINYDLPKLPELSPEDHKKARIKVDEIRKSLGRKLSEEKN